MFSKTKKIDAMEKQRKGRSAGFLLFFFCVLNEMTLNRDTLHTHFFAFPFFLSYSIYELIEKEHNNSGSFFLPRLPTP